MNSIISASSQVTMSSIDLLAFVNTARAVLGESEVRHSDFAARCRDELEDEYYEISVVRNSRGPATEALIMTPDQCKLVAMRESKAVRREVLTRLRELESRSAVTLPDFNNPAIAARAWADQVEAVQAANEQLAIAGPKAAFVDQYVESGGSMSFRQVAKLLKANERQLRQLLLDNKVMYYLGGVLTPYQPHIDAGRFEIKTGTCDHNSHAFSQSRFTAKGVQWIAGQWAESQMQGAA